MEQNEGFGRPADRGEYEEQAAQEPQPIHELNDPTRLHTLIEEIPGLMKIPTSMPGAHEVYVQTRGTIINEQEEAFRVPDEAARYEAFLYCQGLATGFVMGFRLAQIVLAYEEEQPLRDADEQATKADERVATYQAWMTIDRDSRLYEVEDYLRGHGGSHIADNLLEPEGVVSAACLYKRRVGLQRTDGQGVYEIDTADPQWERWSTEGVLAGLWFVRAYRTELASNVCAATMPGLDEALYELLQNES